MTSKDIVIIGGGVAGLAAAVALGRRCAGRILLLEREITLGSHSTGRNAAIWLALGNEISTRSLLRRTAEIYDELLGRTGWLTPSPIFFTAADADALVPIAAAAARAEVISRPTSLADLLRVAPALEGGTVAAALAIESMGVLDTHGITMALAHEARRSGVEIRCGTEMRSLVVEHGRVEGVRLGDDSVLKTRHCLNAAGAWAGELGRTSDGAPIDASLPLTPLRRHLVHLTGAPSRANAVIWNVGDEVYFRPESGGFLASPCDETPFAACEPAADDQATMALAEKLARIAPTLADGGVRRAWACLRTFAIDKELVAGADPRVEGLYWLAGLGGRGMSVGAGAGELVAQLLVDGESPLAACVDPARLLERPGSDEGR